MNVILIVVAYNSEEEMLIRINSVGQVPVSTPGQLKYAIELYSNPQKVLAYRSPDGRDDLGPASRAQVIVNSALESAIKKQIEKSRGCATNVEIAQAVGIKSEEIEKFMYQLLREKRLDRQGNFWVLPVKISV